jgi:class 3 adenylate cyclase
MADEASPPGESAVVVERRIAAPAPLVWALVADTNRFDRAAGLIPGAYTYEEVPDVRGRPSRELVARARQSGFDLCWVEPPYDWIEGLFVRGERRFLEGPLKTGGFEVALAPDGPDATIVKARAWVSGSGALGTIAKTIARSKFKGALGAYLASIERILRAQPIEYQADDEPPAAAARRALIASAPVAITSGHKTQADEASFAFRAKRFAQTDVDEAVRARIVEHLRDRPDEELTNLRPFELARAWKLDRRAVLRGFLHAARAGLVELRWQIQCPTCRVGASVVDSLAFVKPKAHCAACDISYDCDFGDLVEATFTIHSAIRKLEVGTYCASSPWFRPHVLGQLSLAPGQTRTHTVRLPAGPLLVRTLRGGLRGALGIGARRPAEVLVRLRDEGPIVVEASGEAGEGQTRLTLRNERDEPMVLLLERTGWQAEIVLGSVIASLPDFLDLFATEAPASGVELRVSSLTLLFSDLTGSTALYERIGDARAFAVVGEHFADMTKAVTEHEGAIVKTMGDAVMADFASSAAALEAAIAMVHACARAHGALGLGVKIGLHEGPCLAVRANERLDFFGTTVNVAARLQALAHGGEIVIAQELLEHEGVARVIERHGLRTAPFEASLKGIGQVQRLVTLSLPLLPGADVSQPANTP